MRGIAGPLNPQNVITVEMLQSGNSGGFSFLKRGEFLL